MSEDLKSANSAKTGLIFKSAREELGLSITEVSNKHMINIKYLRGIESGSYSNFPSEGFARAYFLKYSNILNIQPEFPSIYIIKNRKDEIIKKSFKSINNSFVKILIGLVGLLSIVLIIFIIRLSLAVNKDIELPVSNLTVSQENTNYLKDQTNNSFEQTNTQSLVDIPSIIPSEIETKFTIPELTAPTKEPAINVISNNNNEINNDLLLYFNNECWIEIQVDGNIVESELYLNGDSLSLSLPKPFSIKVGNVYAVKGTYQGLDIDFITGADRLNVNTVSYSND